jgi:hypothetical protein
MKVTSFKKIFGDLNWAGKNKADERYHIPSALIILFCFFKHPSNHIQQPSPKDESSPL